MSKKSVSAIVPAFNEEKTIRGVIDTLKKSPLVDEIICVNDGSSDGTTDILRQFDKNIILIDLKKNYGKGYALAQGIKNAKGDIVLFLDADLRTLSEKHIQLLLNPLLNNSYKGVIGYLFSRSGTTIFYNITGQRAYYKEDLIPYLKEISETRFGVEVLLNSLFSPEENKRIPLPGLDDLSKVNKWDITTALIQYLKELTEMAKIKIKILLKKYPAK